MYWKCGLDEQADGSKWIRWEFLGIDKTSKELYKKTVWTPTEQQFLDYYEIVKEL